MSEAILEMRGITKRFPGVLANDRIDLEVRRGEIHALLGENGAGKSTLMNILYGLYAPDAGEIRLRGQPVQISGPRAAIGLGIGMVHQHFMLVPVFTVAENIVLGQEPGTASKLDMAAAEARVQALSEQYAMKVDATARVESISVAQQQRVEILKALYRGAKVLILDEPTAVLTPQEVDGLIATMRSLTRQGRTIIFITHKLKEVLRAADRVTVIRRGQKVATLPAASATEEQLASLMVGRSVLLRVEKQPRAPGRPVLEIRGLTAQNNRGLPALRGIDLTVHAGEIVGIAGVDGNGQTELAEVLAGLRRPTAGSVRLDGQEITRLSPRRRFAHGLGHIPEDRQRRGLVLEMTVAENAVLGSHRSPPFARGPLLSEPEARRHARELIGRFDVRTPHELVAAKHLSGGNQQKVIVARELSRRPVRISAKSTTDFGANRPVISAQSDQG